MRIRVLVVVNLLLLILVGCRTTSFDNGANTPVLEGDRTTNWIEFDSDQALEKAVEKFDLEEINLTVCSQSILWVVHDTESGDEYYFSKLSGSYLNRGSVDKNISNTADPALNGQRLANEKTAVLQAREFVLKNVDKRFLPRLWETTTYAEVCELPRAWRIVFSPNEVRTLRSAKDVARLPNYSPFVVVIDKYNGQIYHFNAPTLLKQKLPISLKGLPPSNHNQSG